MILKKKHIKKIIKEELVTFVNKCAHNKCMFVFEQEKAEKEKAEKKEDLAAKSNDEKLSWLQQNRPVDIYTQAKTGKVAKIAVPAGASLGAEKFKMSAKERQDLQKAEKEKAEKEKAEKEKAEKEKVQQSPASTKKPKPTKRSKAKKEKKKKIKEEKIGNVTLEQLRVFIKHCLIDE
jgi:DNA mismatch repair ATPase MutL